jgi:hypothetical protein
MPVGPPGEHRAVLGWRDNLMARCPDRRVFPLCISKQKRLAFKDENRRKSYLIEIRRVISFMAGGREKNAGGKMKVSSIMLLKTNGGKMSEIDLSIMLMKTNIVTSILPLC